MYMNENRKVKITHMLFKKALIDMLQTKHISEISITKLCEQANLNRSTFYAHFQNPTDVLLEIETETYQQLESFLQTNVVTPQISDIYIIFNKILMYIKNQQKLFLVLLGNNIYSDFQERFMDLIYRISKYSDGKNNYYTEMKYVHVYNTLGCISVIVFWLKNDTKESTDTISKILSKLFTLSYV